MILPIFLPHLGCGRRCIYCNQDIITGGARETPETVIARLMPQLKQGSGVALYGGNPLGLPPDRLEALLKLFAPWKAGIGGIRISAKPGNISPAAINLLKGHGVTEVELGIPAFDDAILETLGRDHTVEDLHNTCRRLREAGITVGLQVMVGLPGEKPSHLVHTAEELLRLNPAFVRIYPLLVLKGTILEGLYRQGKFEPISIADAVDRTLYLYLRLRGASIPVIKMGLTDNTLVAGALVAGPYDPGFGSMVRARAFFLALGAICKEEGFSGDIHVVVNSRDVPDVVGYRREHIRLFEQEGIRLHRETGLLEEGRFLVRQGGREVKGAVDKALTMLPFSAPRRPRRRSVP